MSAQAIDTNQLSRKQKLELIQLLEEKDRRDRQRRFDHLFPDETHTWRGETYHARSLYPRHLEFFEAGSSYRETCFMAANRVGKSEAGSYMSTCHLTGLYPDWWSGRRFDRPVRGWAAGKTNETTRDIVQKKMLGQVAFDAGKKGVDGTGMVPGALIGAMTWKAGVPDLIDTVKVKHVTGGWSTLGFKSYQQGRGSFEGTEQEFIWLDEEPPLDVYGECLIRTATTQGQIYITFTPLSGLSEVVMSFLPGESIARLTA